MKKIFTHLFAVLLLSFVTTGAWAQITFTVDPSKGCYSGTGTYCTGWTSNSEDYPETKISVSVNNMATSPASSSSFEIATGQTSPSTWYLMVDGCRILSYSFKCKLKDSTSSITVTAGDNSYVMTTEEQTVEVSGLDNVQKASFQLSGDNKHLVVTELTFTASPILEEGCVYMFKNARADRSLRADGADDVHTKATDANDTAQQWYVTKEDGYYILRNVAYGKYLKGASSSGTGWSLTDDYSAAENKFELHISNSTLNTLKTKDSDSYGYMHDDTNEDNGGCNVVGWLNGDGNTGSHWTITKVDYTAEQITALLEKAPTVAEIAGYTTALGELFTDVACVTPKLESLAEAQASNAYKALPTGLKAMVDKVYNEKTEGVETAWYEDNANAVKEGWSGKYAKKFRVQMYEPYSIAGDITSWLGINAHANNDNPTGIYVPEAGTLYVMVEGTINDGASLRIVDGGHNGRVTNATGGGYALKPGLNVINYTAAAGHLYICYNVDTYNPDGTTDDERFPHKLSDYEPLKIHIEGGAINGFYNAQGDFRASAPGAADDLWYTISGASVDCDADWEYMETRANLSVLPLLAHRQILLFQLEDLNSDKGMKTLLPDLLDVPETPYNNTKNWADYGMGCDPSTGKINIMLEAWDRIMYSELATMGLVSQSTMAQMNAFYPRWESDYTIKYEMYDYENKSEIDGKTYLEFCGVDYSDVFNHHGVALGTESGYMYGGWDHCGYHINTFGGIVQNMANNAGSTWGPAHEIGHQHQAPLTLNGLTEVTNNLFSNIALWYKGMSTSRYNGDNGSLESVLNAYNTEGSDIYTNNIWALTHLYYRLWLYYHLAGNNTQFYPRLFELLRQQPMQKGYNVSGDVSTLHFYKLACQAAGEDLTEFFRAHGYFSIMDDRLVGDYSNSVYEVSQEMIDEAIAEVKEMGYEENLAIIFICDDDENATYVQHDGVTKRDIYGETNPNSDFGSVSDFINGDVSVEAAYTATVSADGTVTMSGGEGGVGFLLLNEKGEVISFSNKSEFSLSDEAKEAIMSGSATFVTVDAESATSTVNVDLAAIQKDILGTLIAKAQPIIDKIDTTYTKIGFYKGAAVADLAEVLEYAKEVYAGSSGYEAAYDLLYAELKKVEANGDAKIPFNSSLTYIITNKAYPGETMWVRADSTVRSESGVDVSLNSAKWQFKETGVQGVYNIYNMSGLYCPAVKTSTAMKAVNTEQPDTLDALYTLQEMEDGVWAIKLSPAAGYRNFHSSWNNVVGWETGNDASRWYLTAVEAEPTIADLTNLEVYINKTEALLGEVLGTVTYTRDENITLQTTDEDQPFYIWSNAPCPTEGPIANLVDGATDNYFHTAWEDVTVSSGDHYIAVDLGEDADLSRFAFSHTTRSADNDHVKSVDVYGSDDNVTYKYLGSASGMPQTRDTFWQYEGVMIASHRYLRFNMHASRGYWHMAEFDIMPVTGFTAAVNDTYSGTVTVDAVTAAMEALLNGKSVAFSMSPTKETIDPVLEVLKTAYKALYTEYEATITARKNTLAELVTETNELIDQVGTVQLFEVTPVELKESNFYCNAPYIATQNADYSAGYVSKLTDGNNSTYLHTRWNANSDDGDFHYLRVDAGDTPIDLFQFTYTTAKRTKKDMPLTMVVEGANEIDGVVTTKDESFTQIAELTPLPEVLNANTVYNSEVLGSAGTKYRYLRFKVTEITVEESDGNGHPFFTMAEFGISSVVEEKVNVNESYKSNVSDNLLLSSVLVTNSSDSVSKNPLVTSVPLLDAQIADQQAAKDKLYAAMNNTAALKENLKKLIDDTQALYDKMATDEGAVNEYY
ncbi:MAG: M60 family metallopeptidase, partial [Bacteroidaceae bacterium]|nr:M60 family metallopeptidase [Bacteroidaceae bacterium]